MPGEVFSSAALLRVDCKQITTMPEYLVTKQLDGKYEQWFSNLEQS
jgi:hypothetical protein